MNMIFMKRNGFMNDGQIENVLIHGALDNLRNTISILDDTKINKLIDMIFSQEAESGVSLLGDSREVRAFFTFQLGLLMLNKPTYAFTNKEIEIHHLSMQGKGHIAIYFVLAKEWINDEWKKAINEAYKRGVKIVIFTQDELDSDILSDLVIMYGVPNSHNSGYYSLSFLCDLIYSLIMNRNPIFHK